ncbi:MAG: AAA family ATPase [Paludibacteraceae bacterium]|nr:AAA family ATPase [Paludibacteraceae bacterium]
MLADFITGKIRQELPFAPNTGQEQLLVKLGRFLTYRVPNNTFVLRGYAGTGKTSMVAALVRAMNGLKQACVLLAPTGRAAKVLSAYAGFPAYTIHKRIYRQRQMGLDDFALSVNMQQDTLFIVDEASMLANQRNEGSTFGSGRLLDDLIQYVFSAQGCSLLLLGDDAQLPPVGQTDSPALNVEFLRGYGLNIISHTLTEVARQALDSGILYNATAIRNQLATGQVNLMPTITTQGFADIRSIYDREDFLQTLEEAYRDAGQEETILITRTNIRTNLYNQGVRNQILWRDSQIAAGDRIMVTKNNYFWTAQYDNLPFLANGDMFEIVRLRNERELYDFHFVDTSLKAVDYDWEIEATLWLDTLFTDSPEANFELQKELFRRVAEDYPEIRNRRDLWKEVMKSPYYNALQVRFAYAVTCHKAQGGQWKRVFIDAGKVSDDRLGEDFYRWFYTAITRAQEQVFLINFPPKK